jgi:hypothetical protein
MRIRAVDEPGYNHLKRPPIPSDLWGSVGMLVEKTRRRHHLASSLKDSHSLGRRVKADMTTEASLEKPHTADLQAFAIAELLRK